MAETDEVEVDEIKTVARGVVWVVAEDNYGITHSVHIDQNYDVGRVIWGCLGHSQDLNWIVRHNRVRGATTSVTCIDCIARGLP